MLAVLFSCQTKVNNDQEVLQSNEMPRHVRVLWTEQPSTHAIVSWTTLNAQGTDHHVHYDTVSQTEKNDYSFTVKSKRNGRAVF